jgi:hypothetical protein
VDIQLVVAHTSVGTQHERFSHRYLGQGLGRCVWGEKNYCSTTTNDGHGGVWYMIGSHMAGGQFAGGEWPATPPNSSPPATHKPV